MRTRDAMKEIATAKFKEHPLHEDVRLNLITSIEFTADATERLVETCYGLGLTAGWWHNVKDGTLTPNNNRNVGEMIALVHSEMSEALEGYRRNRMDDHLPNRPMIEVELADALIRICDMAGGLGLDLGGAVRDKLRYNTERKDHKIEERLKADGKKI